MPWAGGMKETHTGYVITGRHNYQLTSRLVVVVAVPVVVAPPAAKMLRVTLAVRRSRALFAAPGEQKAMFQTGRCNIVTYCVTTLGKITPWCFMFCCCAA